MKRAIMISIAFLGYLVLAGAADAHHGWYDVKYPGGIRSYAEFESALSVCSQRYGDDPANAALRACMLKFGWRWEQT